MTRYYCKNCGSVFEPSLKASFQNITVRCSFCHFESPLVSIPDFETPEQYEKRTGGPWPDNGPVWALLSGGEWRATNFKVAASYGRYFVCAHGPKAPDDDWRPE